MITQITFVSAQGTRLVKGLTYVGTTVNCTPSDGTFKIAAQTDLDALSNCTRIVGNILIESATATSISFPTGIKAWEDLYINHSSTLKSIQFSGRQPFLGTVTLSSLDVLEKVSTDLFSPVFLNLSSLPALKIWEGKVWPGDGIVVNGTGLTSLDFLSNMTQSDSLFVSI